MAAEVKAVDSVTQPLRRVRSSNNFRNTLFVIYIKMIRSFDGFVWRFIRSLRKVCESALKDRHFRSFKIVLAR
jgi:hypothetical protein